MKIVVLVAGTIGRQVGKALHAMGATLLASARTPRDTPDYSGFAWAENQTLFEQADLVTLHCPETPENSGFVNADLLRLMRPGPSSSTRPAAG